MKAILVNSRDSSRKSANRKYPSHFHTSVCKAVYANFAPRAIRYGIN